MLCRKPSSPAATACCGALVAAVEAALEADVHGDVGAGRRAWRAPSSRRAWRRPASRRRSARRPRGRGAAAARGPGGRRDDEAVDVLRRASRPARRRSRRRAARPGLGRRRRRGRLTTSSSTSLRLRRVSAWNAPMRPTPASPMRMRTLPWVSLGPRARGSRAVAGRRPSRRRRPDDIDAPTSPHAMSSKCQDILMFDQSLDRTWRMGPFSQTLALTPGSAAHPDSDVRSATEPEPVRGDGYHMSPELAAVPTGDRSRPTPSTPDAPPSDHSRESPRGRTGHVGRTPP